MRRQSATDNAERKLFGATKGRVNMSAGIAHERLLILDFGSQLTQLIARRVRECHVYCEIHPASMKAEAIRKFGPKGIILSGGPSSTYDEHTERADQVVFELGMPVLGICYGMQTMAQQLGEIGKSVV